MTPKLFEVSCTDCQHPVICLSSMNVSQLGLGTLQLQSLNIHDYRELTGTTGCLVAQGTPVAMTTCHHDNQDTMSP